jgi:H+-transporting ATPase
VIAGVTIAAGWIVFAFGVLFIGAYVLALSLDQVQTLIFVMLVFTGQANVYLIRQRRHLWASLPSRWMMLATSIDFIVVSLFAISGVFMTAVSPILVGGLLLATIAYTVLLDLIKVPFFNKIGLNPESARTA